MPSFPAKAAGPRRVLILTFPGALLLDIAGPAQVFETASRITAERQGSRAYEVVTVSLQGGDIATDTGIVIATLGRDAAGRADTLLVPGGGTVWVEEGNAALLGWIAAEAGQARRVASVCLGAFLLAAAGVLRGRRAVTHWHYCEQLQARYPDLRVEAEPIFVRDGTVWSSAGVSAGIDLALALVEEDLGHAVALEVAQRLVVFLKRPGGQAQFSRALAAQSADHAGDFEALHGWMAENLTADLRVEQLAARAGMSPRSFARLYVARTGTTPARAVEALRLEAARRLLTSEPDMPVAVVATRCGFGDDERMRRAFLRGLGVAPAEYRLRFGPATIRTALAPRPAAAARPVAAPPVPHR
ncbi:GlxA family transcriptional regulator [Rhodovastum atsumiense]|uniref:Helix-turn-helix domain-containing protein n=1 Tax=Rhodovastum atsumiense TaxID=504468 RepID=A0A5M6IXL5_9PROT|nr:helix-turn-helix domain-containing protein [Rhodovastum atsumiense]KAA5612577.1 helix-turn-helix domain-containing protein [Rhodovastum atsumiense]